MANPPDPRTARAASELLAAGRVLSIQGGRLLVDGQELDRKAGAPELTAAAVIELLPKNYRAGAYAYVSFHVGKFEGSGSGVCLNFTSLETGRNAAAFFNASIKRERARGDGKAGEKYKGKKFSPPEAGAFIKFWKRTGANHRGRTEYAQYMGNLKGLLFYAVPHWKKPERYLDKHSIKLLNMDTGELMEGLERSQVWQPDKHIEAVPEQQPEQRQAPATQQAHEEEPASPAVFAAFQVEFTSGKKTTVSGEPQTAKQCWESVSKRWPGQVLKVQPVGNSPPV